MDTTINVMNLLLGNWEVIGLLMTNIVALFMNPPRKNKLSRKEDQQNG
jgi:hypothetical protein